MGKEAPSSPAGSSSRKIRYKFSSAITEDVSGNAQATYGVQFCLRPSKYHIQGGGSVWRGKPPVRPGQSSNENGNASSEMELCNPDAQDEENPVTVNTSQVTPRKRESRWRNLFVTCSGIMVRIYEARVKQKPVLLQVYEDEDIEEQFYCVAWTYNVDGNHEWWVCAAGNKGVLRVMNVQRGKLEKTLTGHGEAINDVKIHPNDSALAITASKDESLRMWNLRTGTTIAVFAGLKGHRGEVVHVDFDQGGGRFASCGIDNSVRIWHLKEDTKVVDAIKESHDAADLGTTDTYVYIDETGTRKKTKVPICQFPYFVTRKVHKHYVDCVMWVGDLLLSKSVHNRIFLWEPGADRESLASPANEYTLLEEYVLDVCNVWFIRFAMDRNRRLLACGNDKGVVRVFDLETFPAKPMCVLQPAKDKNRFNFVRQCAFSEDGKFLLAVDDGSSVMQYERV